MAEDFQIMFGDGTGDNLKGITKYDGVKCVSDIITDAVVSGEAGSSREREATMAEKPLSWSLPTRRTRSSTARISR